MNLAIKPAYYFLIPLFTMAVWGVSRLLQPVPVLNSEQYRLHKAQMAPIQEEILGLGELVAPNERWIIAQAKGTIVGIHAHAGDKITRDQLLLELANPSLKSRYQQAQFDWQQARAKSLSTHADLDIQLEQIESELALARLERDANAQLAKKQIASKLETRKLRLKVQILEKRLKRTREASKAKLQAAQIEVDQFKESMETAKRRLDALHVRAGVDGLLLNLEKPWKAGMVVKEGDTIARIATDNRLIARVRVPVVSARNLKPGLKVDIDSRQHVVTGEISHILPAVEHDEQVLEVALPDMLPPSFRPNQPIRARILLDNRNTVLTLPRQNGLVAKQRHTFYKLTDEQWLVPVQVNLGRADRTRIEVLSGLVEGDKVLLNLPDSLQGEEKIRFLPHPQN